MNRTIRQAALALAALASSTAILSLGACSSDVGRPAAPTPPKALGGASTRAIHVFVVGSDGARHRVDFGQGTEISSEPQTSGLTTQDLHLQASDASGTQLTTPPTVGNPQGEILQTAWALVGRAAMQCGFGFSNELDAINFGELPPWRHYVEVTGGGGVPFRAGYNWFVYDFTGSSCASRLLVEQNLLCVADKLAEIGDAVNTVVWPEVPGCPPGLDTFQYGGEGGADGQGCEEWDIPPQADADRFIVRDLAIHTLGMLATMDASPISQGCPGPGGTGTVPCTCSTMLSEVAEASATPTQPVIQVTSDATSKLVFGVPLTTRDPSTGIWAPVFPYIPPSTVPVVTGSINQGNGSITIAQNNAPSIAASGVQLEAQMLRAGGRLLHDLIRRDVYSDLASASQQSAQTLDPVAGPQLAWGLSSKGPYGTYAHAARVLTGRWEIGDSRQDFGGNGDPQCEGVTALNLLTTAFGSDLAARSSDPPIRTPGEQTAAQLVERSGIVVPACAITSSNAEPLRTALLQQLLLEEQLQNNLGAPPPPAALSNVITPIKPDEILVAFKRSLVTWQLLTNSTAGGSAAGDAGTSCAPVAVPPLPAGLIWDPTLNPSNGPVSGVNGIVVKGGLSRSRIQTDPMARAGGLTEASQCPDVANSWSEWATTSVDPSVANLTAPTIVPTSVFQDAFNMGQSFERRLNILQGAVASVPSTNPSTDPGAVARGAIAELRSWAGTTIVHAQPQASTPIATASVPSVTSFLVRVSGMSYTNDFNIAQGAPITPVASEFGFVYGPPWVAECAAHARPDCPVGFDQNYVQLGTNPVDVTASFATTGVVDNVFEMTVPITAAFSMVQPFQVSLNAAQTPQEAHLYMVRLRDPGDPGGHGHVMGTISLKGRFITECFDGCHQALIPNISGFVDAPMQRELVHNALDLGKWVGAKPPAIGDPSSTTTSGYCVDGVPRDLFVPLDNELISGSATYEDSWQHYLDLAEQAAQTADTLGQALIANDLQIAENQQAAAQQLANICGDFGALSSATVQTNGTITAGAEDPTTQECLNEPVTDVVFLGPIPSSIPATGNPTCAIKAQIGCQASDMVGCSNQAVLPSTPASALQLCKKATLTVGQLKIVPAPQTPTQQDLVSGACKDILQKIGPSLRTKFLGQQYLQDLNDPSLSPSVLAGAVSQLKMTVDLQNNWQVTYGGQVIMDAKNTSYWPACIGNGGCTSPVQSLMAPAWSVVFRDCPSPQSDNVTTPLGCDGSAAAELNMIKWRVTQALWMIGASAGNIPQGLISQPIPAVFSDWCTSGCLHQDGNSPDAYYPPGTVNFYAGRRANAPQAFCKGYTSCQMLDSTDGNTTEADVQAVGPIFSIDPGFSAFENSSNQEVPFWYQMIYSPTYAPYARHILTSNDAVYFDQCQGRGLPNNPGLANPFYSQTSCGTQPTTPVQTSLASIVARASGLAGIQCAQNFGAPTKGPGPQDPAASLPWWLTVTDVKTSIPYSSGLSCMNSWGADALATGAGGGYNEFGTPNGWDNSPSQMTLPASSDPNWPSGAGAWEGGWGLTASPTCWAPSTRALSFSGYGTAPNDACGATALLLQASALACAPTPTTVDITSLSLNQPPSVTHLTDIPVLEAWLGLAQTTLSNAVGNFYVQEVPTRVVNDFNAGTVGSGSLGGTKGQAILTMEQQVQAFPSAWTQIASDLGSIKNAIQVANLAILAAKLGEQTTEGQLALDSIRVQGQMTQAVDQFMVAVAGAAGEAVASLGGSLAAIPAAAVATSDAVATGQQELGAIQSLSSTSQQTEQNALAQALAQLGSTTGPLWADVQKQIDNLRASVAQIDQSGQSVVQAQNQAAYEAAIGTGQDFVSIAGQEVPLPVDTVLRRQASATEQRYQAALTNAKALAYMARRAIEQRIGVTLDSLTQQVGPLDAPASWADDVCSLQGVNFAALSTAVPATAADGGTIDGGGIGGSADLAAINQFADAWVGDYVAKLKNFVTYYNVQYPSHQGDDTAILSLRYDLLPATTQCSMRGPNLLLNSGDLSQFSSPGWENTSCDPASPTCLVVAGGYALASPQDGPFGAQAVTPGPGVPATGVTWLLDVSQVTSDAGTQGAFQGDAAVVQGDASGSVVDASDPVGAFPHNVVAQQVNIPAGSYVLSWWDQARDQNGLVLFSGGASPIAYLAEVFDPQFNAVAVFDAPPYAPPQVGEGGAPSLWSARHTLSFTVANTGRYTIAFGASAIGAGPGSVAIADVQLEAATSGQPSNYVATTSTTLVSGASCILSDSDLRAGFVHNCDSQAVCSYDLAVPLVVDTTQLGAGDPLGSKLANGNYNYRHLNWAINLVGTNVHSCANDPNPNCYGSAYVQYDIQHDATSAGIIGFDGNARIFNFGVASINHGKALAAERYLTVPLSSNDQQLISQPGIQHIEYGGRPIDGTYHLRIWDSPDLNWTALEDVQVVLNYEYWSQIQTSTAGQSPGPHGLKRPPPRGHILRQTTAR